MSDGLTDGYRSSLAAERRCSLFRSITASLLDWRDNAMRQTAVNDIMAFERWLCDQGGQKSREAAAVQFLDNLRSNDTDAWTRLLASALRHGENEYFRCLKNLSPLRDAVLLLVESSGDKISLVSATDLEQTLSLKLGRLNDTDDLQQQLVVVDCKVVSAPTIKD
jgi:hypothetical protein